MLDSETKRRIDYLRDILVGKIPSPQSQVEQITTGLIYKFMYDMDVEAVEMGGVPSFFVGDYEKYSWKHLFEPTLGGADKVQLYSDAIENMYNNPTAPPLFREIFKNSFLPFKDPSTLNMFLKEINEFHYSHSENLGDAFEYLLSFMGSQGDAGQFRTPRHIIDFIVEIVNPQKNETILDPACGTAGFLISSYKHILSQNTDNKLGDKLNASDRKQVGDNLVGYDISPDMTRISLVNMYLHQFASPQIHEYDTLSSDDRWNEYYDVILANPPFMTPKGGIQPHARFGVQSKKAEVLFVDYIVDHLKPDGRAGIVVPEGIVFQNGTAYKKLRKKLIENALIGVISLPAGVFKPYSGVKTSILLLDKQESVQRENIFFSTIDNDGFSLGDKRIPINKNDLPKSYDDFRKHLSGDIHDGHVVKKETILNERETSLSIGRYIEHEVSHSEYPIKKLGDLITLEYGKPLKKEDRSGDGFPVYGSNGVVGYHKQYLVLGPCIVVGRKGSAGEVTFSEQNAFPIDTTFFVKLKNEDILLKYLFHSLKKLPLSTLNVQAGAPGLNRNDAYELEIPLPPIEVQQQIVDELEGYQKIIDGCRQVIENYKPTIDIDPSWEMVELGEICSLQNGYAFSSKDMHQEQIEGSLPVIKIGNVGRDGITNSDCEFHSFTERFETFLLEEGDLVVAMTGATVGKVSSIQNGRFLLNQRVGKFVINDKSYDRHFIKFCILSDRFYNYCQSTAAGGGQDNISGEQILQFSIPKIDSDKQKKLVMRQHEIQSFVNGNKNLVEVYTQKIHDRISKVWGE